MKCQPVYGKAAVGTGSIALRATTGSRNDGPGLSKLAMNALHILNQAITYRIRMAGTNDVSHRRAVSGCRA